MAEREVLLSVQHLEQFFKMGRHQLKAVNDVSFDIYKGEVFGLVGESGCGKTTTGRSIIRLYDITGGSVYFRDQRIAAGTRRYKEGIKLAVEGLKAEVRELNSKRDEEKKTAGTGADVAAIDAKYAELIVQKENACKIEVERLSEEVKRAKFDHKYCNREYAKAQQRAVDAKYADRVPLAAKRQLEIQLAAINAERDAAKRKALTEEEKEVLDVKYSVMLSTKEAELKAVAEGQIAASDEEQKALLKEYKDARRLAGKDRITNKMQMIFQDPIASLDPRMTVREIIAEGLIIRGIRDKAYIDEQVYKVLDLVGLVPEHAGRYPHEFSGGQRQRIGIARAIILNPELIIADEPISALDVSIQAQVINLLNELRERLGLTILFIAHDLSVVKYFSDRIAVMYFGNLVELTTSDELFAHPLHPYTRSLLSAIPLPDPHFEKQRKRITYNPLVAHDYTEDKPSLREVSPGHFVHCNQAEFERYVEELNKPQEPVVEAPAPVEEKPVAKKTTAKKSTTAKASGSKTAKAKDETDSKAKPSTSTKKTAASNTTAEKKTSTASKTKTSTSTAKKTTKKED
ncbi:MAG: ABC transporter ATP-binding protein [Clostridiales bacterium]|nr:ABC transporter ATP-binding protein [Clostridiales bacterium]